MTSGHSSNGTRRSGVQGLGALTLKEYVRAGFSLAKLAAICLPIWAYSSVLLVLTLLRYPRTFFVRKGLEGSGPPDPLPGLQHRFVEANGLRFHVVTTGKARSGKLMLCVHGFPSLWSEWRNQMAAFRDDYEVVAFDMRGYGETSKPKGRMNYSLSFLVDDIGALIPALGYESCVLVSHDWGAVAAWSAAYHFRKRIDRFVAMAVPHPAALSANMDWSQWAKFWYMFFFQAPIMPELFLTANKGSAFREFFQKRASGVRTEVKIPDSEVERVQRAFAQPGAATAALNYYRALFMNWFVVPNRLQSRRVTKAMGKLDVPTLLLYADKDMAMGTKLARGMDRFCEDVQVYLVRDCSHWIPEDRPEEVNKVMKDFLAGKRVAVSNL